MTDKKEKKAYRLAIRRPVATSMLFLTLIVFGWKSYQQLSVNLMPDIMYPTLTVRTEYTGAAPVDIEKLVTRPLEESLSIVSGLVEISSVSSPGVSEIVMEFTWDTKMNTALQDVRDQLDMFRAPVNLTEKPVILRYDPTLDPILRVAISGRDVGDISDAIERDRQKFLDLMTIREAAERHLKSDLEAEVGIAQVLIKGGREEEIQILVDSQHLKNIGLSMANVKDSLAQQNINLSGGSLLDGKTEYLVRTLNEFVDVDEIGSVIVGTVNTQQVRLEDIATVWVGNKDRETIVHVNGHEAVGLEIYKEGNANTVEVCTRVKKFLGFKHKMTLMDKFAEHAVHMMSNFGQFTTNKKGMGSDAADDALARIISSRLPNYAKLTLISDQSRFIEDSIKEVQHATVVGGLLALVILFFFLREIKTTLIIGAAIPISVISTFIPLFARDISLNIMSLGGLALGVGMLVDNSIVVLESIFRCREEGDDLVDAADRGTREVGSAVTASTLTTIAVFLPITFVEGIAGQLFGDLALTVTFSLIASLLVALYLIPMIASRHKLSLAAGEDMVWLLRGYREARNDCGKGRFSSLFALPALGLKYIRMWFKDSWFDTMGPAVKSLTTKTTLLKRVESFITFPILLILYILQSLFKTVAAILATILFLISLVMLAVLWVFLMLFRGILWLPLRLFDTSFSAFRDTYVVVLRHSLRFSPVIILIVAAIAVHAAMTASTLGQELIPPLKQGEFGIRVEAPVGTRIEETENRINKIEWVVSKHPDVDSVTVEIGSDSSQGDRSRSENIAQFTVLLKDPEINAIRQDEIIEQLRKDVSYLASEEVSFTLPSLFSFKTAVELQIFGDDLTQLKSVSENVLSAIDGIEGLKDPDLSMKKGYPEIIIELDRDLLASKSLSPQQVATRVRAEVQGEVATRFNRFGEKVDIRVRSDRNKMQSLRDLQALSVVDRDPPISLASVANIRVEEGPSEIRRIGQRQVAIITANIEGRDLRSVSDAIMERLQTVEIPQDFEFVLGGQNRELRQSYSSLIFALLLAIFLVYVVMACQFESFWHPALVMFSVPLAFIGVVYVLDWMSIDLSVVVFIGGIVLAGIVVNDAIVLVDYINQLRRRGLKKRDAIIEAGKVRLRPIIMTTVTTVLGLMPMVIWSGEGAEMRRPMAITVMAGLSSATVLTLLIIPMVYELFGGRDKC